MIGEPETGGNEIAVSPPKPPLILDSYHSKRSQHSQFRAGGALKELCFSGAKVCCKNKTEKPTNLCQFWHNKPL